jgi:hypothetical protein
MRKRSQAALREIIAERQMSLEDADALYKRFAKLELQLRAEDDKNLHKADDTNDFEEVGELSPDDTELFMAAFTKILADGTLRRFNQAYAREPERVKKRGFYVDVGGVNGARPADVLRSACS